MIEYQKILNKNLLNVFIEILKEVEVKGLDGNNQLYITFATNNSKTLVPNWLLQKYPNEMTIVIQHEYYHLSVNKKSFNIGLSFNNKKCDLRISFDSITSFVDPLISPFTLIAFSKESFETTFDIVKFSLTISTILFPDM